MRVQQAHVRCCAEASRKIQFKIAFQIVYDGYKDEKFVGSSKCCPSLSPSIEL